MLGDTGRVRVERGTGRGESRVGRLADNVVSSIPGSADLSKQRRRSAPRQECRV